MAPDVTFDAVFATEIRELSHPRANQKRAAATHHLASSFDDPETFFLRHARYL
jgi:hypothetical protein